MKIELRDDIAEMVSELLHGYQELIGYDMELASYCGEVARKFVEYDMVLASCCGEVAKKFDDAVRKAREDKDED